MSAPRARIMRILRSSIRNSVGDARSGTIIKEHMCVLGPDYKHGELFL